MNEGAAVAQTKATAEAHAGTCDVTAPVLMVKDVVKAFGAKRAVDGVSLEVMPGDIFGFVGHNGAGKTTLIRAIVGVTGFDEGDIRIAGQSVRTDALACKRVTAYVPDNPDVYEFLTGIQYLNYIADLYAVPADVRRERIEAYADPAGPHFCARRLGVVVFAWHAPRSSCSSARSCTNRCCWCWTSPSWGWTRRRRSM